MKYTSPAVGHRPLKLLLISLFWILSQPALAAEASVTATPLDQVTAIVNDDVITATELQNRIGLVVSNLKEKKAQLPPASVLRRQVLDSMVIEKIQVQRAKQFGIVITDDVLENAIAGIAARNKMSPEQLHKALVKDGNNFEAFRNQIRAQTAIRQLINREVNSRINISKNDIDSYLRKREQQQNSGVQYNFSHILLTTPENASQGEIKHIKKQAKDIFQRIHNGESFSKLAIAHSRDQHALDGGLIGWRAAGQIPELFVSALKDMKPGEISAVLKSPNGFHILKLNKKRGGIKSSFRVTQTHARHILFKRAPGLSDSYLRQRLQRLRQRIIDGEDFGKLARVHSDDVASAVNDGSLDWVTPGTMVPSFEQAMDRLKPGVVSKIVESPYGFHIIEVLGRREKDLGKEKLRADAQRELHIRKAGERYQTWIRRLRDQAYVEYVS